MTPLEQQVAELLKQTAENREVFLELAGSTRAFECAVLALISTSTHPKKVEEALAWNLNRVEADLVFKSMSEVQLEGFQTAKQILAAALDAAKQSAG